MFNSVPTSASLTAPSWQTEFKQIGRLMWPLLVTQVAQTAYGLIDTVMAGRVSAEDLAAVAIGAGLWLPLLLFINGVLMATTPLVAESLGARRLADVPRVVHQGLWIGLILGVSGILALNCVPLLFDILQVPITLRAKTALYIQGVSLGLPACALYNVMRNYTEALGQPRPVTVISLIGLMLSIPANALFIYGYGPIPALGGAGCGLANAIVLWILTIVLAWYVTHAKRYTAVRLFQWFELPHIDHIRQFLILGLPIGVAIFFEASLFTLAAVILSPLGAQVVAAHQIGLSVTSQLFMLPLSLGMALTIRVGNFYGQQHWAALLMVQRVGFWLGTGIALSVMLFIAFMRHTLAAAYTADVAVQQLAAQLLILAVLYQLFDAWQITSAAVLRGLQDTRAPMWITLFCYWGIALPLGIYCSRWAGYGAQGFWAGLVVGLGLAAMLLLARVQYWKQHYRRLLPDS